MSAWKANDNHSLSDHFLCSSIHLSVNWLCFWNVKKTTPNWLNSDFFFPPFRLYFLSLCLELQAEPARWCETSEVSEKNSEIQILDCFNMALGRWRRAESGGRVYVTEKKLQNTGEALIHTQQHTAFKSDLFKIFHMKTLLYDQSLSIWVQFSHLLHECQPRNKTCWLLWTEPEFSICLPHYISQGIGGHNLQRPWPLSCFKPLHNPLQIPQASQCGSSWHAFPTLGLMECSRVFRWFSTCFVNLRRY